MKHLFFLLALFCAPLTTSAQDVRRFSALSWNVENLFDTVPAPGKDDAAFLPTGEYRWDSPRYWRKQGALARTILEAGALQPVDIVGLCEVENDSVVHDLCRRTRLAALGYDYVVTESGDRRGVDVALVYQPATFRLVGHKSLSVPCDTATERPTRDILLCTGVIPTGDTLDVFVVHFPSRRGGARVSEPYRLRAADVVVGAVDSLRLVRRAPLMIIMGDCNDEPADHSVQRMAEAGFRICSAEAQPSLPGAIAAQTAEDLAEGHARPPRRRRRHSNPLLTIEGTYFFQREWSRIDNVLLSHEAEARFSPASCSIFTAQHLLETDGEGFPTPFRTYRGPMYLGGVSDHLPLLLEMSY